ncbi:MAG: DUF6261 family protein [Prolixibacteraceae bacterium]
MEINKAKTVRLRNEEHFQFHKEAKELIEQFTPAALHVEALYPQYQQRFADETDALDTMRKNSISDALAEKDQHRDKKHRGLKSFIASTLTFDDEAFVQAAIRLMALLKFYGNVAKKPYNEETGAIHSLVNDLREKYADDVTTIGATNLVNSLDDANKSFESLMRLRYTSEAAKSELRMKETRIATDASYFAIVERINAGIIFNGEEGYTEFVKEMNERIERMHLVLALRFGQKTDDAPENPVQ